VRQSSPAVRPHLLLLRIAECQEAWFGASKRRAASDSLPQV